VRWLVKGDAVGQAQFIGELFGLFAQPDGTLHHFYCRPPFSQNFATKRQPPVILTSLLISYRTILAQSVTVDNRSSGVE
jgi:hypothetical protein